jgi:hypothetical protein
MPHAPGITINSGQGTPVFVSLAGGNIENQMSFQLSAGDTSALITALSRLEIPANLIEGLQMSLYEAQGNREQEKHVALEWLAGFTYQVASGAVGGAIGDALPSIAVLIASYVGMLT